MGGVFPDLPTPINEIKIISQRHTQRSISQVIPDSVRLTIDINLYNKDDFECSSPPPSWPQSSSLHLSHARTAGLGYYSRANSKF